MVKMLLSFDLQGGVCFCFDHGSIFVVWYGFVFSEIQGDCLKGRL